MILEAPLAYGASLAAAGCMLSAAVALGSRERILERLGRGSRGGGAATSFPVTREARGGSRLARTEDAPDAHRLAPVLIVAGALGGLVLGFALAGPVGALAGAAGSMAALRAYSRPRPRARSILEQQFRDAVVAVASGVRAGLSLRRAFEEAARDAEPPMRQELEAVTRRLRIGEPLDEVLSSFASRLDVTDAGLFVAVLRLHHRTGGELPALLDQVAAVTAERIDARRQARVLTAQGRASGAVLAVLPVAFVALLSGTGADGLGAFYRTSLGSALLLAGLACDLAGFLWIRRIVRSAEDEP